MRNEIMKICYNNLVVGRYSQKKTKELIRCKYYWPTLHKDVIEYVGTCDLCQRSKATHYRLYDEL